MAIVDLILPKMGESIIEATILRWHKKVGDHVKQDETILDIATDKVDSEVPSTVEGVITEILFNENDVAEVGAAIAKIEVASNISSNNHQPITNTTVEEKIQPEIKIAEPVVEETIPYIPQQNNVQEKLNNTNRFYSPLVLNIANSEGISLSELENIEGTGADGRVSKKDILQYVENRKSGNISSPKNQEQIIEQPKVVEAKTSSSISIIQPKNKTQEEETIVETIKPSVEIIEMDRMRKLIAKHMVDSKHTSPHVTSFAEADVTNMVVWREKIKDDFEKKTGTKITFTPMIIECLVKAMKKFPIINSSVDGDKILIKNFINIGVATALPNNNLIVPVIKNADQVGLISLAKSVNELGNAARRNKLKPDDTQGGTFTFSNVGTFGSLMGTPIINQPQVAIMASGSIKKRAVVIESDKGDFIAIRSMMYLSLSYDHRIIDGSVGIGFLSEVVKELEKWDVNRQLKVVEQFVD